MVVLGVATGAMEEEVITFSLAKQASSSDAPDVLGVIATPE